MADITITPADFNMTTGTLEQVTAGATIAQGDVVYEDSADSKWKLAQSDGTAEEAGTTDFGIAATGAANNQEFLVWKLAGQADIGGVLVKGVQYVISTTPGGMAPYVDLVSTNRVTFLGYGNTATEMVGLRGYTGETIT